MSKEDNKAIIRRFYDTVINRRHLAVLNEILAPDFEECKAEGADHASHCENFKHILAFALRICPECQQTIHAWHIEKDVVMARWSLRGKKQSEYLGTPGVEQQFRATGSDTFRLVDGKIREYWVELDTLYLGRQLVAMVPPCDEGEERWV